MKRSILSITLALAGVPLITTTYADTLPNYRCSNLYQLTVPSGYYVSSVTGMSTDGSQVVGIEGQNYSGFSYALVWNSPTPLATNLNPTNSNSSAALATNGTLQVGSANKPGPNQQYAMVWSGTANSGIFLNPKGYLGRANGVAGDQIVGFVSFYPQGNHAYLWTGSTYTGVDLQPSASIYYGSDAVATDGVRQAGYASLTVNGTATTHAMLWSGTASSAVDLNPTTTNFSQALGISGSQQVGIGVFGSVYHAMVWTGSANSAVDLNPSTYLESQAVSTNGTYQIGFADQGYGTARHAMVWAGSAGSAVDLSLLVPGGATSSQALAIDAKGNVFGYAVEQGQTYAVEWAVVPEPATLSLLALGALALLRRRK